MITGVITTNTLEIYIDGALASASFYPNSGVDQCTGALEFGRNWASDPRWYQGEMDDIGVWNRALTNCEIQKLYSGPLAPITTITVTGNVLTADQTATSYQWLNCNSNYSEIVGANAQSFNPTTNGSYAVTFAQTIGFCSITDTAACVAMNSVTLIDLPAYVPASGLVGYWPFNGNANDESGNLNHGTPNGNVYVADRDGNNNSACSFDGVDDYVIVGHSNSISSKIGTINYWVNTTSSALMQTVKKSNFSNATGEQYSFAINASSVNNVDFSAKYNSSCAVGTGWESTNTANAVNNGNWNMITGLITSDSIILYINGVRVAAQEVPNANMDECSGALEFGRNWNLDPRYFNGAMDDIGIWNRVLSVCEIEEMYNSQLADYTVTLSGATLTSNQAGGASYQWIDCANNTPVNGATAQSFLPSVNGNYAVVVTTPGGCSDTSACQQIASVGINEVAAEGFRSFPNPATDQLNIATERPINLGIYDAQGELQSTHFAAGTLTIDISGLSEGVYFLRTDDGRVMKFVKTL